MFNYLSIATHIEFSEESRRDLLAHIKAGNQAFLSAYFIDQALLDSLNIKQKRIMVNAENKLMYLGDQEVELTKERLLPNFKFFYYFETAKNISLKKLGYISMHANFIAVPYGKGTLFLHSDPQPFSNYYVLKNMSYSYAERALLNLSNQTLIWDDYHNNGRLESKTPLRVLLQSEALKYAYFIALILLSLYIAIGGRRKQRAIPIVLPPVNASEDFVRTLSNLYYSGRNHQLIANVKLKALFYFFRKKYKIKGKLNTPENLQKLSRLSNRSYEQTEHFIKQLEETASLKKVGTDQLIELNNTIDKFITH